MTQFEMNFVKLNLQGRILHPKIQNFHFEICRNQVNH